MDVIDTRLVSIMLYATIYYNILFRRNNVKNL